MAKSIKATPVVKGRAAERIRSEMRHGTPDTPARIQTIKRADLVFSAASARSSQGTSSSDK
jgi:hypothetical protein